MTKKIIVFVFIFCSVFSFSQESKVIDSLKREIKKNIQSYDDYNELVRLKATINPDTVIIISKKMINDGNNLNDPILIGLGYKNMAKGLQNKGDYNSAKNFLSKSLIKLKNKNNYYYGTTLIEYANILQYLGNIKTSLEILNTVEKYIKDEPNVAKKNYGFYLLNVFKAYAYSKLGLINESIKLNLSALKIIKNLKSVSPRIALSNIAGDYVDIYDKKNAEKYYFLLLKDCDRNKDNMTKYITYANMSRMYRTFYDLDKASEYIEKCIVLYEKINGNRNLYYYYVFKSNILREKRQYDKAIFMINYAYKIVDKKNEFEINEIKSNLGHIYYQSRNFKTAKKYYDQVIPFYKKNNDLESLSYILLSYAVIEGHLNNSISSEQAIKSYDSIKNIMFDKERAKSIEASSIQFRTAEKEAKIKEQQLLLEKEKANRNMALASIVGLAFLSFCGFWFYRTKQKQKQLQTQNTLLGLQQNLNAMQLDNLNKQLNPHEIKNILANISPEIQRNAPEAYNKMTKLLNLTKASLSSNSVTDSIENQLHQIEDYLSLEKTVLPVPLQYSIHNTVETNKQIPRLLLKNIVENSIKHGIKNKKEGGEIKVNLSEKENNIFIEIDDTGIGRQQVISLDSGIGTSTYINLFETLNKTNTKKASFNIIDKENGTKVEIYIPTDYKYS